MHPDQLAFSEASRFRSALFSFKFKYIVSCCFMHGISKERAKLSYFVHLSVLWDN